MLGRSDADEKSKNLFNIPQMIYKLLEKIFIFTMLGHGSDEVNQILYGLLHNALKQECFNETQKLSMRSWIDKLGKVYDNVVHPKSYDKRRLVTFLKKIQSFFNLKHSMFVSKFMCGMFFFCLDPFEGTVETVVADLM